MPDLSQDYQLDAARLGIALYQELAGDGIQVAVTRPGTEADALVIEAWLTPGGQRVTIATTSAGVRIPGVAECLATTIREQVRRIPLTDATPMPIALVSPSAA